MVRTREISLVEARQKRKEARHLIAQGIDPGETRREQAEAILRKQETFEAVAREWHMRFSPQWGQRHVKKILAWLENDVFPAIGSKPLPEITASDLLAVLRPIEARGATHTAHRVRGVCGQVFGMLGHRQGET